MNTRRRDRRIYSFSAALVASLLAILSSLSPTVSAQTAPGAVLATQFFGSITGEEADYQLSPMRCSTLRRATTPAAPGSSRSETTWKPRSLTSIFPWIRPCKPARW